MGMLALGLAFVVSVAIWVGVRAVVRHFIGAYRMLYVDAGLFTTISAFEFAKGFWMLGLSMAFLAIYSVLEIRLILRKVDEAVKKEQP